MVPVEVTAFGLLAVCLILLAAGLAYQLVPRPASLPARLLMLVVLTVSMSSMVHLLCPSGKAGRIA
jgi:hypothetical protein